MSKKILVALVCAAVAASCAVNPITGKRELSLVSESQEIEMGKQTDVEVAAQYGVYDDPALSAYVSRVGMTLAAKTQRPGLPYRFTVLDSPVVNAFAVPGGSVYVTRGILAMMSSEAELAAVLGHELGHVNARHSAQMMTKQTLAGLGLAVGSIISSKFAQYAGLASTGLQVLFLKYSRDDENQSDALGVDYSRAAGYNPADMAVTFTALQKMGDLSGGRSLPGFLSTHPVTADRIQHVQTMLKPEDQALARRPEPYLQGVQNIVYGDDPRQGYVENGMFYHPALRFQFAVPSGWTVNNTPGSVTLVAADQNGGLILRGGKSTDTAEQFAQKEAAEITKSGGQFLDESRATFNGLAWYERAYTVTQQNQAPLRMRRSYLKKGEMVYIFAAVSSVDNFPKYEMSFKAVVGSFSDLADASKINRSPKRLALVKANGSDTLQSIFQKAGLPQAAWPQFAVMNGLETTSVPPSGRLIKVLR